MLFDKLLGEKDEFNLKIETGLEYEYIAVDLRKGEQHTHEFLKLNPVAYVPVLVDGDKILADSLAILMYLDEKFPQHPLLNVPVLVDGDKILADSLAILMFPQHPLLPKDSVKRAINFQAASVVSSSIQPYQLMFQHLREKLGPEESTSCIQDYIRTGFAALEKLLKDYSGQYATGSEVFLADLFLAPQIHAAITRFQVDMDEFRLLSRLFEAYMEIPAFRDNMPGKQPDAPAEHRA